MRKILTDGIEKLKPQDDEPDSSRAWRVHDSLFCCYVQQLNQQIVADQLCISPRQLRREQRLALEALTDLLVRQVQQNPQKASHVEITSWDKELDWVQEQLPDEPTLLDQELQTVKELTAPLAKKENVSLEIEMSNLLRPLAIHPVVLNQILVNLVNAAIKQSLGGQIRLTTMATECGALVAVGTTGLQESKRYSAVEEIPDIQVARELAKLSRVEITFDEMANQHFAVKLLIPWREQFPVLVVDDNMDTLQLFERYVSGSRYRLIVTRDAEEVLDLVGKDPPLLIVLDIMMPKTNGWKVLGMLKQHPLTQEIPVMICTILPQEELAFSLGAEAFVNKPISRQVFLGKLDELAQLMGKGLNLESGCN
ncbi:MAG: hybrid sensor histidine kinase/response regulator [Anaerolineales bacterium]|nr:hybrid sensor histidine kinase/response regulator [Anaerolineales bacterium]